MKKPNGLVKRGLIYCAIGILGLLYEFIFVRPLRQVSIFLWLGVLLIGIMAITQFKDTD